MSNTTPVQIQSHLSEDLYFLRKMSPQRLYQRTRSPLTARLLDTVALFLTTGPSNPTLATFWWAKDAKLYIAKSPPSDNDAAIAETFFDNLKRAQGFESMVPFLATYGQANVNKRISHLHYSLSITRHLFKESHDTKDPYNRLKSIILDSQPPFVFDDSENAISTFKELVVIARRVLDVYAPFFTVGDDDTCRLQRHLDKMGQYLHVGALIKFWKKHWRRIELSLVPDMETNGVAHTVEVQTIMSRHLSVIPGIYASSPEELRNEVVRRFRSMPPITITPHIHAEIRLILHVSEDVGLPILKSNSELFIGSNKTSCFACTCWRKQFNSTFQMNWKTTCNYSLFPSQMTWKTISSNGRPRSDWAIPSDNNIPPLPTINSSALRGCYEAVHNGVQGEMKAMLERELVMADDRLLDY
ncbi:hypothetical protein C0995_000970 [Termitomyces sp. Mi166|nr:hypothetical protein C0995_000970 [Termitomyces sp. Mi166\